MQARGSRGPLIWPLALIGAGVVLLLDNFLLFENFNTAALWPLLLVIAGAAVLLRGDVLPDDSTRTFGITRGSVESASLEINAGEIDVFLKQLEREGRLIAGQYAANARPTLTAQGSHAQLRMNREETPWMSFADWVVNLAHDLPWQPLISTHLGQVHADFSGLITNGGMIATGIGDIRLTSPEETLAPLRLQSAIGNIHVKVPRGHKARITVAGGRSFGVHTDERRYVMTEPNLYIALEADPDAPIIDIQISGTFGDAYLA